MKSTEEMNVLEEEFEEIDPDEDKFLDDEGELDEEKEEENYDEFYEEEAD